MREYKPYKHQMGVEGPSFWKEQQERRQREQETQGRDQPKTQESAPKHQPSMWDFLPHKGPTQAPAPVPQVFQRRTFGFVDATQWLEVAKIWDYVGQMRSQPQYRGGGFIVDIYTPPAQDLNQTAAEISQFFNMPASNFEGLTLDQAWKQVIGPFLESLEMSMSRMKPMNIPGALRFEIDEELKLVLAYQDR